MTLPYQFLSAFFTKRSFFYQLFYIQKFIKERNNTYEIRIIFYLLNILAEITFCFIFKV